MFWLAPKNLQYFAINVRTFSLFCDQFSYISGCFVINVHRFLTFYNQYSHISSCWAVSIYFLLMCSVQIFLTILQKIFIYYTLLLCNKLFWTSYPWNEITHVFSLQPQSDDVVDDNVKGWHPSASLQHVHKLLKTKTKQRVTIKGGNNSAKGNNKKVKGNKDKALDSSNMVKDNKKKKKKLPKLGYNDFLNYVFPQ